jgi:MATE family multidrug resistance protein
VLVQLGLFAMGAVDAAFMGRVSEREFAAVALGHSYSFAWLAGAMGVLAALDPFVAQAHGARDDVAITRALQRGIVLALWLSVLVGGVLAGSRPLLELAGQPPEVVPLAMRFLWISIVGVPGFLLFVAERHVLQATARLRPLLVVIVLANVLNAALDWLLIEGRLGAPALGSAGCAWATVFARWSLALLLPLCAGPEFRRRLAGFQRAHLTPAAFAQLLRVGLPIGLSFGLELAAFAAVLLLMGQLGERELAAHQVVMTLASGSFMLPLGIAMAAAVRVGNAIGRGDVPAVQRAARSALVLGALCMSVSAGAFMFLPRPLASWVTDLEGPLALAVTLLPIAGLFQVFDGLQSVALGCLRGTADTKVPMLIHLLGFWGVAVPASAVLGLTLGLGARGLWWGLALGLFLVAVVQVLRLRVRLARPLWRIESEAR